MITVESADGTTIASDRTGSGPPLVLVGGAFTSRSAFEPLAALLAPHFTVYGFDRRGRGDSGDTPPYAVEREIEDVAAIVEVAGGSAYAFGHSSGAVLALDAAAHGVGLTKLALYEPPFIIDDSRTPPPANLATHIGSLVVADRRSDAVAYWMEQTIQMPPDQIAQARVHPSWASLEAVVHTAPYDATIMANYMRGTPLPADRWSSVTASSLVMVGENSQPWQQHGVNALVALLPGAARYTLVGADHGAPPEQLAPVLTAFFAE